MCDRSACLRLPPLEFRSQCLFALIDERLDRLRVRDREDELHLAPAQGFDLGHGAWHPRLGNLGLADSTETLAKQGLHRLDPGAVIRNRDLLAEALPALRTGARRPRLPARAGRSLEEDTTDRLDFLRGGERERGPYRRWATELCDLSSIGSASATTGTRWRALRLFAVIAVDDRLPSELVCESRVMLAQVSRGRYRPATAAITKFRAAEIGCLVDVWSVTPSITRARRIRCGPNGGWTLCEELRSSRLPRRPSPDHWAVVRGRERGSGVDRSERASIDQRETPISRQLVPTRSADRGSAPR